MADSFHCPNCYALYKVVKIEAGPETPDAEIACRNPAASRSDQCDGTHCRGRIVGRHPWHCTARCSGCDGQRPARVQGTHGAGEKARGLAGGAATAQAGPNDSMWIVRLALNRPYTFIVPALLILLLAPTIILRTPTDTFPNINIPVVWVARTCTGLDPEDIETRMTTPMKRY